MSLYFLLTTLNLRSLTIHVAKPLLRNIELQYGAVKCKAIYCTLFQSIHVHDTYMQKSTPLHQLPIMLQQQPQAVPLESTREMLVEDAEYREQIPGDMILVSRNTDDDDRNAQEMYEYYNSRYTPEAPAEPLYSQDYQEDQNEQALDADSRGVYQSRSGLAEDAARRDERQGADQQFKSIQQPKQQKEVKGKSKEGNNRDTDSSKGGAATTDDDDDECDDKSAPDHHASPKGKSNKDTPDHRVAWKTAILSACIASLATFLVLVIPLDRLCAVLPARMGASTCGGVTLGRLIIGVIFVFSAVMLGHIYLIPIFNASVNQSRARV